MKTFTQYIVEDDYFDRISKTMVADEERIKAIKKTIESKGYKVANVNYNRQFDFYEAVVKHNDFVAKFLFDNVSYIKSKEIKINNISVYHRGYFIYNLVWYKYYFEIVEYFAKTKTIFDKLDSKVIDIPVTEIQNVVKKLDRSLNVNIDEKLPGTGKIMVYINKPTNDPYHKINNPFFGYELTCVANSRNLEDYIVKKITAKVYGFYDDKFYKDTQSYDTIKKSIDSLIYFKKIIEDVGYTK